MSGRYKVHPEPLGQGGMATVHRAEVTSAEGFRRPVALKYIHPELANQPDFEAQFRAEARVLALLQHPNIVQVLDFDRDADGRLFIVMELVDGVDLRRVRDHSPVPVPLVVHTVAQVLRGLDYAYKAQDEEGRALQLVHRDLSPQNVLVSWGGAVKITDFGIAQGLSGSTTRTGVVKGNAGYLSPEQIEGDPLDARSDLYAVGVLTHELLLGVPLYARPGLPTRSILTQILLGKAPAPTAVRPEVPAGLSDWVMRLLAHDRAARPASAADALRELLELGLVPATVDLDFVAHLEGVRRAGERPTLLEEEAPADLALATRPMPALETIPNDTHPHAVPIDGLEPSRRRSWLPLVNGALLLLVLGLGWTLLKGAQDEPKRGRVIDDPIRPVPVAPLAEPDASVMADAGARVEVIAPVADRPSRARRSAPNPTLRPAPRRTVRRTAPSAPPPEAGARPAPDSAPDLLPYEGAERDLLPYEPD